MKDQNFKEINKDLNLTLITLTWQQKEHLEEMIELDSEFLREHGLMDYSLLLVVEELGENVDDEENFKTMDFSPVELRITDALIHGPSKHHASSRERESRN